MMPYGKTKVCGENGYATTQKGTDGLIRRKGKVANEKKEKNQEKKTMWTPPKPGTKIKIIDKEFEYKQKPEKKEKK